jgi:hypothetical protein
MRHERGLLDVCRSLFLYDVLISFFIDRLFAVSAKYDFGHLRSPLMHFITYIGLLNSTRQLQLGREGKFGFKLGSKPSRRLSLVYPEE